MQLLHRSLEQVSGFIYPNEVEIQWSVLIVLYPYITGLVAGAFILAALYKVFGLEQVKPVYRLALLSALAFLLGAPLTLNLHLGHPERAFQIMATPNVLSAMAMFGFIYLWYLVAILLIEIWLEYRPDIIELRKTSRGPFKILYSVLALGVYDLSPRALELDHKIGKAVAIVGIPSAAILHGYVGFIFGSVKANSWWSTPLMPVIFLMSAVVSGIAMVMLFYMGLCVLWKRRIDMSCVDVVAKALFLALIVDFSLEMLEFIQKMYEAEQGHSLLMTMLKTRLWFSMIIVQIVLGSVVPLLALAGVFVHNPKPWLRKAVYFGSGLLISIGVFAMRWNVVIGGQLFSKSFRGLRVYEMPFWGIEGSFVAAIVFIIPFGILAGLLYLLPPWKEMFPKEA